MNGHESTEIEARLAWAARLAPVTRTRSRAESDRERHIGHHAWMTTHDAAAPCLGRSSGQRQGAECSGASSNLA